MEQNKRRRSRFAVLLVSEKEDGTIKKRSISSFVIELVAIGIFLLGVLAVCRILYDTILIEDMQKEMVSQMVSISNLSDENEALGAENTTLSNKVAVLSETVSKKMETAEVMEAEAIESALPKGFPLSGSATMFEAQGEKPMLLFKSAEGINVITTGMGTVESIDPDEEYGVKIVIDHGNGYKSVYLSNNKSMVKSGDSLGKGYILFQLGEDSTELGYQILKDDEYIDPMNLIEISG